MKRQVPATRSESKTFAVSLAGLSLASCAVLSMGEGVALAEAAPPVDVVIKEPPPPTRVVALQWNPVDLVYRRISVNLQIVPVSHHAIVLTPYYFDAPTAAFTDSSGNAVPSQKFEGFGGELGYRYFTGLGGPRGFFIGPSLVLADVQATAGDGTQSSLADFGVAVDAGFEMLVADSWAITLGLGAEYVFTSKSLPDQQWPANLYANNGFHPRPLFALGYAF